MVNRCRCCDSHEGMTELFRVGNDYYCRYHLGKVSTYTVCSNCREIGMIQAGMIEICPRCRAYIVMDNKHRYHHSVHHEEWLREKGYWYEKTMDEETYIEMTKGVMMNCW